MHAGVLCQAELPDLSVAPSLLLPPPSLARSLALSLPFSLPPSLLLETGSLYIVLAVSELAM